MKRLLGIALWGLVLGVGCSSTIRAKETSTGGEITLTGGRRETMELATPVMSARCGGTDAYQVLEDSGAEAHSSDSGEWRLTYQCKGKAAQEAKPAAPAPPQS